MAATFAFLPRKRRDKPSSTAPTAATKRWEVHFSRFFGYPPSLSSTCPDLVPLPTRFRNRRPGAGHWVSSSSPALLQLVPDLPTADLFLSVCFGGKILEEHRVSKLQFVWPRVSCNSEIPARGTRAVFAIYRNCMGQVEKFALRFLSTNEAEKFMSSLKEIFDIGSDMGPRNTDLGSEISSQSEFMSSNGPYNQVSTDLNIILPAQTYTTQISPSLTNEAKQYSCTPEMTHTNNFHGNIPAVPPGFTVFRRDDQPVVQQVSGLNDIVAPQLAVTGPIHLQSQVMPPSFTSRLGNCHPLFEQVAAQSTASQEGYLKSQFMGHVGDASFQDMLIKMETVISEMGGDLSL